MTIETGQAWVLIIAAMAQGLGVVWAAIQASRAKSASDLTAIKVDEDKAETRAASGKVDDLNTKADDIHKLVNSRSDAQEQRIKALIEALLDTAEKRVTDQKEAAEKVLEATTTATTAVQEALKDGVPVIPIDRRNDKSGREIQ